MRFMFSFEVVEDYIIETDNVEEAEKLVNMIWEFKQSTQNDMLDQYSKDYQNPKIINYSIDVNKYITEEE